MMAVAFFWLKILSLLLLLSACSGVQTFPNTARAGDTAAIAAGWKHGFSKDKITLTITPSAGSPIVYLPGDPAVRAVINFYPDPLSSILISTQIGEDLTPFARTYAEQINFNFTDGDRDWWQTMLFIDLPFTLPVGAASIDISSTSGETYSTIIDIISGVGQAEIFHAELNGPLFQNQLAALERVGHYVISFIAATIPHAMQLQFSHNPDAANGGSGVAYVVNPRGDLKNALWSDDGINLRVVLTPAQLKAPASMSDYKFYIAGGVTGLLLDNIQAVDINGYPVSGVVATIKAN